MQQSRANVYLGNVQTNALKYYEKPVNTMLSSCYAGIKNLDLYQHKMNILNEYGDINVYYAQNIADNLHYKEHYLPFIDSSKNSFRKIEFIVYEHKESGHNPISKKVEYDIIESIFNHGSIKHIYEQFLENKN